MSVIYDLILILDPSAPDAQRAKIRTDAEAAITAHGEVVGIHDWGLRTLAYEIDHKKEGEYHLIQFRGPAALLETLQRSLSVTDAIIRFRIIKLAPGTPEPVQMEASIAPAVVVEVEAPVQAEVEVEVEVEAPAEPTPAA